ncbi:FAD-dependent oxidoreductase [Amycolatopsis sp. NBRC 101858]|uniref:FAD-dependent monooxygenase n=1 Tax=Amycolatopsis sp. NBRC 101858 TaxID=3032200 RepID=UPI0024A20EE0|nr:FAD-dependent monooxygenase [Amycolatopsis sp. NBRC 101858]GLY43758.1 FAD-dependent oxidoreductase [Amycolatopsis sp. NBRC 101858]
MDVAVIGAGPVGLMLAAELRLGGAEVVVLDRRAAPDERPRANGLGGRIVEQLDHRGLLDRFRAEAGFAGPFPGFPFGPVPLNFAGLDSPMRGLMLQQPRMEALLTERALELGAEIRRGHELADLGTVRGADGSYRLEARYVVGCDGAHSRVRELAGIGFPGTTDDELMRLGHFRADLPMFGSELQRGWNRRPGGRVLVTSLTPGVVIAGVREVAPEPPGEPTLEEFHDAVRRVLGTDLRLGEPLWLSRTVSSARLAERYRAGNVFLAGDAAHVFPAGGSSLNVGLLDAVNLGWKLGAVVRGAAPESLLDSYHAERHPVAARTLTQTRVQALLDRATGEDGDALRTLFGELAALPQATRHLAGLLRDADELPYVPDLPLTVGGRATRVAEVMRAARPVLFDFAGRADLREAAGPDVKIVTAECPDAPAEALFVRPDGVVAWKGGDPAALREAMTAPGR